MSDNYIIIIRQISLAVIITAAILLVFEAIRPGTTSTLLPLTTIAIITIIAIFIYAILPKSLLERFNPWHLLLLGWLAAIGGWVVYGALNSATRYSLAIGCLSIATIWTSLLTLVFRRLKD